MHAEKLGLRLSRRRTARLLLPATVLLLALAPGRMTAGTGGVVNIGTPQVFPAGVGVSSIACADPHTCYVVGNAAAGTQGAFAAMFTGVLFSLTDGTLGQQRALSAPGPVSVACSSSGACYASDKPGPNPAGLLPIVNGVPGQLQSANVDQLNGLACSGGGACYAVGERNGAGAGTGVVVPIVNGQEAPAASAPGTQWLTDIDCPTADVCYAVGAATDGSTAVLLRIVDGQPGPAQRINTGAGPFSLDAIACPDSDTCVAAGSEAASGAFVMIADGRPGPAQGVDGTTSFSALACPSSSTCLAFGGANTGGTSAGVDPVLVPIVSGTPGSVLTIAGAGAGPLLSGDCATAALCYAITASAVVPITIGGK